MREHQGPTAVGTAPPGLVLGVVHDTDDPEGWGRVKVQYPWLDGYAISEWAPIASLMAGNDHGAWFIPQVGSEAVLAFDRGDFNKPFVLGFMWNGQDAAPSTSTKERMIRSANKHTIRFLDSTPTSGGNSGGIADPRRLGQLDRADQRSVDDQGRRDVAARRRARRGAGRWRRPAGRARPPPTVMSDVTIDIPVNQDLQDALNILTCADLGIHNRTLTGITTPMGFELPALRNLGASIPDDCALTFSLTLQLMPFMASIACLLRILALLKPLINIIGGLPSPPGIGDVKDFATAAADLTEHCIGMVLPVNLLPFIRDILCFIRAVCSCLATNLKSVQTLMTNLALKIEQAQGNPDLLTTLNCAQKNAQASAANLNQAIQPIATLMAMVTPIIGLAGKSANLTPPTIGPDPQAAEDLTPIIETLQGIVTMIDDVLGALGLSCAD